MRDRLLELLCNCPSKIMGANMFLEKISAELADHLLKNGVIAPPCKVGETVYVIKRCRCGKPENYDLKACGRKIVAKTPKVLARVMFQETGKRLKPNYTGKIEYEIAPKGTICYSLYEKQFTLKMLTEIGKTVFFSRKEAEQALKGGEG